MTDFGFTVPSLSADKIRARGIVERRLGYHHESGQQMLKHEYERNWSSSGKGSEMLPMAAERLRIEIRHSRK
jgi:hypothetical protein